ncbi:MULTISPECIES: Hcp family type VI secretion system effector [Delftia]|uniref:Hcp family type VI secretion system effector n=1 Tax=Delftia deserti TaxID=1651218 RepID=A0ABW5EK23_9BURK|nr:MULTISPECIES: type VI secretion system tube protein Hcp [Delftia]MBB1652465.1 hypothetical protein [Delftia sp. UME58]MBL8357521.1 type VI secretion system tube protein Hcp [Delftia acidovorans]
MAIDMFLKVSGATGESQDAQHKGWTHATSFTWGAAQSNKMASGGGAGAGKVSFHDLNIVAMIDKCYPAVLKHCSTGKHIDQVEIDMCKAGGDQMIFGKITLSDVLVTSVYVDGIGANDMATVHYTFQAAKIKNQYWEQNSHGGKGSESQMSFNIKENREI